MFLSLTSRNPGALSTIRASASPAPFLSPVGALLALCAATLLCWPMLITSAPLLYFDTVSYFTNGEQIWGRVLALADIVTPHAAVDPAGGGAAAAAATSEAVTFRSLPYATFFYPASMTPAGVVLACILQTAMTLWMFLGLVPPLGERERRDALLGFAAVGTLSTLPWFASYAMPDLLGAVLPVYFALALGRADTFGPILKIVLMGIAAFAILSHYGHLPLALVLCVCAVLWRLLRGRLTRMGLVFCVLPVALAFAVNFAASIVASAAYAQPADGGAPAATAPVSTTSPPAAPTDNGEPSVRAASGSEADEGDEEGQASFAPNRIPVLLARSIEDGPGRWYLQEECRTEDRYAICELFDKIPSNVWAILWSPDGIRRATPDQLARIRAEETEIVFGAAQRYPVQQGLALAKNTLKQTILVGTGELLPIPDGGSQDELAAVTPRTVDNETSSALTLFDWIAPIFTGLAFLVLLSRMVTGRTQAFLTEAIVMVFLALVVNAAIYGGLSAPVDRYQSRIAWLVPALLALDLAIRRRPLRDGNAPPADAAA